MRILSLLLAGLLLAGCAGLDTFREGWAGLRDYFGGSDNTEPPAELKALEASRVTLKLLWDAGIGDGYDGQFVNLVPGVSEDRVYAADRDGKVQAHDRLRGAKLWSVELDLALSAGPVVDGDQIILATSDAEVLALNAADGAQRWKTVLSSEILALPRVEDGRVVVRTTDGRITALDARTGAPQWTHDRLVPALSVRSRGAPGLAEGLVVDGYASGKLIALDLRDGKTVWEATVAIPHGRSEIERLVDIDAEPVIRGEMAYVTGHQAGVSAVVLKDGEILWRQEKLASNVGMAAGRRSLFVTDSNSDVWQLDLRNGADLWKQDELHQRRLTAPVLIRDYLVVGDFEGWLHVLSQDDGSLLGRIRIDKKPIEVAPVVHDEVLYVYTSGGTLAAVSLE